MCKFSFFLYDKDKQVYYEVIINRKTWPEFDRTKELQDKGMKDAVPAC